jgi:hypothetical protein
LYLFQSIELLSVQFVQFQGWQRAEPVRAWGQLG